MYKKFFIYFLSSYKIKKTEYCLKLNELEKESEVSWTKN